jgi:hypothetical protein
MRCPAATFRRTFLRTRHLQDEGRERAMVDFYDLSQNRAIAGAAKAASSAQSKASSLQEEIQVIHKRIDRLKLVCNAMWEMIRDNTSITEDDVLAKVKEIDARDGLVDGRHSPSASNCRNCGRTVQKGQEKCQYCGTQVGFESVFDWVR